MKMCFRSSLIAAMTVLAWSTVAHAQSPAAAANAQSITSTGQARDELRPTTTTFFVAPAAARVSSRRDSDVKDYFVSRGIASSRLRTASYGEKNPEHANIHEEARKLNRRVALVIRLEP
jgi:uncharacterized protein YggE